ncbi:C39 family peptidase [Paenibacillus sp. Dod16]|uniref:C39 family peptidase n=1 Tax=Paenibacillus sp. Dod16 TaxID=3416392 RepID=UPI003CEC1F12
MILNIIPKKGEYTDCKQHLLITVAEWWNRRYELLFIKSCSLNFNSKNSDLRLIGERLETSRFNAYNYFEEYHGVKIIISDITEETNIINMIITNIRNNHPVVVSLNSFWTPWNTFAYKKIKANHYCLVIGINERDKILYCLDPTYSMEILELPFTDFINGCTKSYAYFEKMDPLQPDIIKIFGEVNQTLKKVNTPAIEEFALEVGESFDFKREIIDFPRLSDAPININLVKIIFGHQYLSKGLDYLGSINPNILRDMKKIRSELNDITIRWKLVHNIISKEYMLFQKSREIPTIARISPMIRDLGEREAYFKSNFESFYQKLICI